MIILYIYTYNHIYIIIYVCNHLNIYIYILHYIIYNYIQLYIIIYNYILYYIYIFSPSQGRDAFRRQGQRIKGLSFRIQMMNYFEPLLLSRVLGFHHGTAKYGSTKDSLPTRCHLQLDFRHWRGWFSDVVGHRLPGSLDNSAANCPVHPKSA